MPSRLLRVPRRRLRLRMTAGAAAVLCAAAGGSFPTAASAAEKGLSVDLTWVIPDADKARTQSAVADLGARWVRLTVNWKDAEPTTKGSYNAWWLAEYDKALSAATAAGARPIVVVAGTPGWANGGKADNVPPTRASDYADFLRFIATRIGDRVDAWEIWNEQNTPRFWTGTVAAYVTLLKAAYPAVKTADPTSTVLFGGLSLNDWAWVRDAYAAGAKGAFDAMAVHPYTYCGSTGPDDVRTSGGRISRDSFTAYREVHAEMIAAGDGSKDIWATEFGWTTSTKPCDPGAGYWTGGVSEAQQAANITKAYEILAQDAYVPVAVLYNARNNYWAADNDNGEDRFGLMSTNFSPKPGYAAFKAVGVAGSAALPPTDSSATDTAPPTVSLTAPTAGATVSGSSVTLSADAADNVSVGRVDFLVDGTQVATDSSAPYSTSWDSTTVPNGSHTITARATDGVGNQTTSGGRAVTGTNSTGSDTTPPVTTISCDGGTCSSAFSNRAVNVALSASDTGGSGVSVIRYTIDGSTPDTTSPAYSAAFSVPQTTTVIYRAYDLAGNAEADKSQTIRIDGERPTATITSPTTGSTVTGGTKVPVDVAAGDTGGSAVAKVRVYVDGQLIGTDTSAPYSVLWSTSRKSGSRTLVAEAEDGAGNVTPSASVPITVVK